MVPSGIFFLSVITVRVSSVITLSVIAVSVSRLGTGHGASLLHQLLQLGVQPGPSPCGRPLLQPCGLSTDQQGGLEGPLRSNNGAGKEGLPR